MKNYLRSFTLWFLALGSVAYAQPTDNPYRTLFNPSQYHWTDSLKWSVVTDASTITGLLEVTTNPDSFNVNIPVLNTKMAQMSASGGGVLYFGQGTYYFNDHLYLQSRVVIRGEASVITSPKTAGYLPLTQFVFPRYLLGNDRSTAFKEVTADTLGIFSSGLVNIDLNRAVFTIAGGGWTKNLNGTIYATFQPRFLSRNIIVFGVRNNNAAIPDPSTPNVAQMGKGATASSQAWPWRFGNNINIMVSSNCVVANCRVNDNPTDNYLQPNYQLQSAIVIPDVIYTEFNYLHHSGISVNRDKLVLRGAGYYAGGPHGAQASESFIVYANPSTEPVLFAPGVEIRNNWVKTLTRVKIKGAGNGLIIDNNICTDNGGKKYFIREAGTDKNGNFSATYENRGIDVSGWNVKVTRNSIFVQRGSFLTEKGGTLYISVDGEVILVQECCGGTSVNDYTIADNIATNQSSGYIGLYNMRDLNNVKILRNNLGGKFLKVDADVNGCLTQTGAPCYKLNNVVIDSNFNVSSLSVQGKGGGVACGNAISRNIFTPGTSTAINNTSNIPVLPNNILNGKSINTSLINGTLSDASGDLILPTKDTLIDSCSSRNVDIRVKIDCGSPDSVVIYQSVASGLQRLGMANLANGVYSYTLITSALSPKTSKTYPIIAKIFSNNGNGTKLTKVTQIKQECNLTALENDYAQNPIRFFPNPSTGLIHVSGLSFGGVLQVSNSLGTILLNQTIDSENEEIDLSSLSAGIYFIGLKGYRPFKLIKE